jgi:hypothetical protein
MLSANDWAMKVSIVLRHIGAGVTVRICNAVLRFRDCCTLSINKISGFV